MVGNDYNPARSYSELFGAQPTVARPDYAKWMLVEPCVNFAISSRGHKPGVNHLGFQVETSAELAELSERARQAAGSDVLAESATACCYTKSDKYWVIDPQGLAWEHFHTLGEIPIFGEDSPVVTQTDGQEACCIPLASEPRASADESSTGACCVPTGRGEPCC